MADWEIATIAMSVFSVIVAGITVYYSIRATRDWKKAEKLWKETEEIYKRMGDNADG